MKLPKFLVGVLIGGLLGIVFWYWQKSTSAEDGALEILDRLAASDTRARDLEARLRDGSLDTENAPEFTENIVLSSGPAAGIEATADNLQAIDGIGPTYARRLQEAGVYSFADLAGQTPKQVMEISAVRSQETAESWILAAQERLNG